MASLVPAGVLAADGQGAWRVMIIIPEYHLERPIPDPAAETEFIRQFLDRGQKVIDDARWKELRYEWAERLKDPKAAAEMARQAGADVIITGEAISQRGTDTMGLISCRARVEVRAILADTAEILVADAMESGGADPSEAIAAKKALQNAARILSGTFATRIDSFFSSTANLVEITVSAFPSLAIASSFQDALGRLEGIAEVSQEDFTSGVLRVEARCNGLTAQALARELELNPKMKPFALKVEAVSKTRIRAESKRKPSTP